MKVLSGLIVALATLPSAAASGTCSARSAARIVPLVELYTSEGCSSCPPADRWLSARRLDGQANWLSFHVDYWDDLGWPDRFASPMYSARQRQRVAAAGQRTVYTPQVMVGAQVQAPWRSENAFGKVLRETSGRPAAGLAMSLQLASDGWSVYLGTAPEAEASGQEQVWVAQYVDAQSSKVRAGENRGAQLRHDRVVRELWGPWPLGTEAEARRLPVAPAADPWGLVVFIQQRNGTIVQSLHLPGQACTAASDAPTAATGKTKGYRGG